jgi:OPA family glycerol-3-phosphate transporter-like MFS transporter
VNEFILPGAYIKLAYLIAAVLFIQGLKGLGHPRTAVRGNMMGAIAMLIAIGFLIYGPVMLIGVFALDLVPKKAAGTAAGFTGLFGYVGGSVSANILIGYAVDQGGWDAGFKLIVGACILAIVLTALTVKAEARNRAA